MTRIFIRILAAFKNSPPFVLRVSPFGSIFTCRSCLHIARSRLTLPNSMRDALDYPVLNWLWICCGGGCKTQSGTVV